MPDETAKLRNAAGVPTCKTCAHKTWKGQCAATGWPVGIARKYQDECSHKALYWTPKPPSVLGRLLKS